MKNELIKKTLKANYSGFDKFLITIVFCICFTNVRAQVNYQQLIKSPDGKIILKIEVSKGILTYALTQSDSPVIEPSAMGLIINNKGFGNITEIGKTEKYTINETYTINGVHSIALDHCNGKKINLTAVQHSLILDARAYNNGVAFRYITANQGDAVINKDSTQFKLPAGVTVWSQPNVKYYEGRYVKKNIADFKAGDLAGPPVTIELPGNAGYAAITEGGLTDFAGMSLIADGNNGFIANLTGVTKKTGNIESPWRIIEIGKDLNVSPKPDPALFPLGNLTDWIKPGRSVWSWLAIQRTITLDNMKHFSDLAAQLGFEYNLVDEGWGNWKDGSRDKWDMMKELVDYSAEKGIKVWVWKAYPDRAGIPGINTPEKRQEFFRKCKDLGIAGLKVDFFDSEAQEIIDFYQAALKDAANYHLMMDFHGANKPTGENRTWPNELTREAIRGMENQAPWAPGNTILPFTRYLAGPADFTPVHFGNRLGEVTWAHHVATMVVFTSPLLCVGADPQSILNNPCKQMIQSIPPTWDETIVLPQSKIGELALYARRKGSTWYIAAMNGVSQNKNISINLSFLKKGNYTCHMIKDDPNIQANAVISTIPVSSRQMLNVAMNTSGGFVARIE